MIRKQDLSILCISEKNTYFWLNDKTSYFLFIHMNKDSSKTLLNIIKVNVNTMNFNSQVHNFFYIFKNIVIGIYKKCKMPTCITIFFFSIKNESQSIIFRKILPPFVSPSKTLKGEIEKEKGQLHYHTKGDVYLLIFLKQFEYKRKEIYY